MAVYFAEAPSVGLVKIGLASNVSKRMAQLRCGSPVPLILVASMEGDGALERRFHLHFEAEHFRDEWFTVDSRLRAALVTITEGSFDMSQLPDVGRRAWAIAWRKNNTIAPNGRPYRSAA